MCAVSKNSIEAFAPSSRKWDFVVAPLVNVQSSSRETADNPLTKVRSATAVRILAARVGPLSFAQRRSAGANSGALIAYEYRRKTLAPIDEDRCKHIAPLATAKGFHLWIGVCRTTGHSEERARASD